MKQAYEIWDKIIEKTHLAYDVITVGDVDALHQILDERESLIQALQALDISGEDACMKAYFETYKALDEKCGKAMNALRKKLDFEFIQTKKEQQQVSKSKNAHDRYQMNLDYSGLSLDQKK